MSPRDKKLKPRNNSLTNKVQLKPTSTEYLRDMLLQVPAAIAIVRGKNHVYELANPLYHKVVGKKKLIGLPGRKAIPELIPQGIWDLLDQVYTTGKLYIGNEMPIKIDLKDDGDLVQCYFNFILKPLIDTQDQVTGIFIHAVEVSDIVQARLKAQESEMYFRTLTDTVPQIIWTAGPDGHVDYWSKQWYAFSGLTQKQSFISPKQWVKLLHPDDRQLCLDKWSRSVKTGEEYQIEYRLRSAKTGTYTWYLGKAKPIQDSSGTIIKWFGSLTDISEQKKTEEKLARQNTIVHTITRNASLGLFMINKNHQCTFMNPAAEQLTGYTFEEIRKLNKPLHDIVHYKHTDGSPYPMSECPIDKALSKQVQAKGEDVFIRKDGSFCPIAFTASPILENGKPTGTVVEVQDTTELKQREEVLRKLTAKQEEALALLESLLKNAPVGFAFLDKEHKYVRINDTLAEINGLPAQDHIGKRIEDIFPKSTKMGIPYIDRVIRTGKPILNLEMKGTTRKNANTDRYLLASFYPVNIGDKPKPDFVGAVVMEITDRKIMEQRIHQEREQFQILIDSIPVMINLYNPKLNIKYFNKYMEELTGWTTKEAQHGDIIRKIYPDSQVRNEALQHMASLQPDWKDMPMKLKDGRVIESSWQNIKLSNNIQIGIGIDISQRKKLEQRKDEFIGIASHELKTPLTSIKGYTQILERILKEVGNERAKLLLSKTNSYVNRLNTLISDLLDVSKIQAGKLQFNMEYFDIQNMMIEAVDATQQTTESHKIECVSCSEQMVYGDKYRLEQVFTNLLSNAIKYSPKADKIEVRVDRLKKYARVAVTDFGIGIPIKDREKLFERFYRVDPDSTQFSGLGIGLYISSEIIKRHGGKIWVESKEGRGSTFYFTIPRYNRTHV